MEEVQPSSSEEVLSIDDHLVYQPKLSLEYNGDEVGGCGPRECPQRWEAKELINFHRDNNQAAISSGSNANAHRTSSPLL